MRKLALLVVAVLAVSAAPAAAKLGPNPTDKRLAVEFLRLLHTDDDAGLRAFLAPGFLLQRADGTWLTKAQYLENPAHIESYSVTDVVGTREGDVRVVRYTVTTVQTIDGQPYSNAPVPRLSTFVRHKRTWRLIAHANFNAPAT